MTGFAGFDRSDFPGGAVMAWLKANTNLKWCGFYLPSPSHPNDSWLQASDDDLAGWGLAPIYLGQETTGPGAHHVNGPQGTIDGADACRVMKAAGFDHGAVVYLDNEAGPPLSPEMQAYISAWAAAVAKGGFTPGAYCSFYLGAQTRALGMAKIWAFHVKTTAQHWIAGANFPELEPSASGYSSANVWQLDDEAIISCDPMGTKRLVVDLNSADSADPSAP